jgi:hypothetical protein
MCACKHENASSFYMIIHEKYYFFHNLVLYRPRKMCTIIKVKRKIDENPVDQLVIECKKQKIILPDQENVNEESIKQIFKYFGTAQTEVI